MASRTPSATGRPLRLLSLDGGGVRGLSSIMILRQLMKDLGRAHGRVVQPWEVFDMMGGTSTGGLIAIMLGRLRMTIDECEAAYLRLSERIFDPKRSKVNVIGRGIDFLQANGKFDAKALEDAIKETIRDKGLQEDELLQDPDFDPPCRVFVCAVRTGNSETGLLRSYDNGEPELLYDTCKIWEACRATSAATTFFDPIRIGPYNQEFADGGVIYNNPIQLVHRESELTWPGRTADALLVSIGTGSAPGSAFQGNIRNIVEAMKEIVTQTERTADDFFLGHGEMTRQDLLYRFNVYHGLADVGLEEWQEKAKMADATQTYLARGEVRRQTRLCASKFVVTRPSDTMASLDCAFTPRDIGTELFESLHFVKRDLRYHEISEPLQSTFHWVFDDPGPKFTSWLESDGPIFWISGKAGSGKSTMMKFVYDDPRTLAHLKRTPRGRIALAGFFFHDRGESLQKSFIGLMRAILLQILETFPELVDIVIPTFKKYVWKQELEKWQKSDLLRTLNDVVSQTKFSCHLCLFIDGLDEFDGNHLQIAEFFKRLVDKSENRSMKIKACVSSRPLNVFEDQFGAGPGFPIHKWTEADILQYATAKLQSSPSMRQKLMYEDGKSEAEELKRMVVQKASGVFLWVRLVIDELMQGLTDGNTLGELQERLHMLPDDLEGLYIRMLARDRVDRRYLKDAALFFHVVQLARSPLSVVEFANGIQPVFEIVFRAPGKIYMTEVLRNCALAERRIRSFCGGMLEITGPEMELESSQVSEMSDIDKELLAQKIYSFKAKQTVQFLHQTVNEFLRREENWASCLPTIDVVASRRQGFIALTAISLAKLKVEAPVSGPWAFILDDLIYYAREIKVTSDALVNLLDEVDATMRDRPIVFEPQDYYLESHHDVGARCWDNWVDEYWKLRAISYCPAWHDTFLSFTIDQDIIPYVKGKMKLDLPKKLGRPLLHYAIQRRPNDCCPPMNPEMVEFLLQNHEDPNRLFEDQSAWHILLQDLQKPIRSLRCGYASTLEDYLEVVYLMVDYGADLDFNIGPPHRYPLHLLLTKFAGSCYPRFNELLQLVVKKGGHLRHKNSAGVTISDAITKLELSNAPKSPHLDISREESGSRPTSGSRRFYNLVHRKASPRPSRFHSRSHSSIMDCFRGSDDDED